MGKRKVSSDFRHCLLLLKDAFGVKDACGVKDVFSVLCRSSPCGTPVGVVRLCFALLCLSLVLLFPVPAFAESGFVTVKISNTSDIVFDDNDVFHVFCTNDAGEETDLYLSITSFYNSDTYAMEEGSYRVSDIEYVGNNWDIYSAGFGVCDYFSTQNAGDDMLQIAVGESALEALQEGSSHSIISYDDSYDEGEVQENPSDISGESSGQEEDAQSEPSQAGNEETEEGDSVVYYEQENSGLLSSTINRMIRIGINLLICAVICGVGLLIFRRLHNRGYF